MIALHGSKIDPGRAIVFTGLLMLMAYMLYPPRTYVYNVLPAQQPEEAPAA